MLSRCPDPPLEPPMLTDAEERINAIAWDISDMERQISDIEQERDEIVPVLKSGKYIIYDHRQAIINRYAAEIERLREVIRLNQDAIATIQEGL